MKFIILLTTFIPSLVFANCEQFYKTVELCGDLKWTSEVKTAKPTSFELKFYTKGDAKKTAKDPKKEVNIFSWMKMDNGHDHGGPGLVINKADNIWKVEKARFFGGMSGSWWIRVELKDGDKVLEMQEFPVKL